MMQPQLREAAANWYGLKVVEGGSQTGTRFPSSPRQTAYLVKSQPPPPPLALDRFRNFWLWHNRRRVGAQSKIIWPTPTKNNKRPSKVGRQLNNIKTGITVKRNVISILLFFL